MRIQSKYKAEKCNGFVTRKCGVIYLSTIAMSLFFHIRSVASILLTAATSGTRPQLAHLETSKLRLKRHHMFHKC